MLGGGKETQEGEDICIHMLIHIVVPQKLTIILQLNKQMKLKNI